MLTLCGIASNSYDLAEIRRCWFNAHLSDSAVEYNIDGTRVQLPRIKDLLLPTTLVLLAALTVQTYRLRSKLQRRDFVHVGIAIAITVLCVVTVNSHKPVERVTKQRSITTTTTQVA